MAAGRDDGGGQWELELPLGQKLQRLGPLTYLDNKMRLLETGLRLTRCEEPLGDLEIDQYLAMLSAEQNLVLPAQSQCIFCQAFHKLFHREHRLFRHPRLQQSMRVSFRRSPVVDVGGVFRETMSSIVESAFSPQLALLLPTPNNRGEVGSGRDLYVPSPNVSTPLETHMLEFLGIMTGIAVRNQFPLPFRLPRLVYKRLLGHAVGLEDLRQIDVLAHELLQTIRHCDADGVTTDDAFQAQFDAQLTWSTTSVSGALVDLDPEAADRAVEWAQRHAYCDRVLQYRLHELDNGIRAIQRGLSTVVPAAALQLFTSAELEVLICGVPEIDLQYLKRHTRYENYRRGERVIRDFWRVFRDMSQRERSLFIKFVWGRERLPRGNEKWKQKFTISRYPDVACLPVAHTCFFKIDLPPYKTRKEMRKKLHLAMASANAAVSMLLA